VCGIILWQIKTDLDTNGGNDKGKVISEKGEGWERGERKEP